MESIKVVVISIKEEVESIKEVVESIKEEVESIKEVVESIKEEVESIKEVVESIKEEVESIKEVVESIKEVVESIKEVEETIKEYVESIKEVLISIKEVVVSIKEVFKTMRVINHHKNTTIQYFALKCVIATMKIGIYFIVISLLYLNLKAQNTENVKSKIKISEFSILPSTYSLSNSNAKLSLFKTLAPQSVLLNKNLNAYEAYNDFSNYNNALSFLVGFSFFNTKKQEVNPNHKFRLGITYYNERLLSQTLYNSYSKRYDTLTSSATGNTYYLDSITNQRYDMNLKTQQLRLDISYLFSTNSEARWQLYTGLGFNIGKSFNATTTIEYYEYTSVKLPTNNVVYSGLGGGKEIEKFKQKNTLTYALYLPLGISFRIGKKREFWKRTHLFFETRATYQKSHVALLNNQSDVFFQTGMGLKIKW